MSKFFKLKNWLTVPEAAKRLSIIFGEEVSEPDVLRFALDGHLKLSAYLVNGAYARPCVQVKVDEIEWDEMPSLDGRRLLSFPKNGRVWQDERGCFQVLSSITELESAVWDLPMIGNERLDVEFRFQILTSGLQVTAVTLDGVLVASDKGDLFEIQTHCSENKCCEKENVKLPFLSVDNFHPAGALPEDCVFVVRTKSLAEFEKLMSQDDATTDEGGVGEKLLGATERNSLLTIIAGLCDYSAVKHQERGAAGVSARIVWTRFCNSGGLLYGISLTGFVG